MNESPSETALWKRLGPWAYYHYPPDQPSETFGAFSSFVDVWHQKKQGRILPSWSDFDFYDFRGWHGWISVFDIQHDPLDWRCRLSGTYVDELLGGTRKNKSRDEVFEQAIIDDALDFYELSLEKKLIGWSVGPVNQIGRDHLNVQFLELPCSNDGSRVDHTIEATISRPYRDGF